MKKYLIFQFACYGDCLLATAVARQIKHDEPGSHITWAIASKYKSALDGNPHVDTILELKIDPKNGSPTEFVQLDKWLELVGHNGDFDEVIHLQIINRHLSSFYTTLRRTVLELYGKPITVDVSPVVHLTEAEKEHARAFAERNTLAAYEHVILFECSPASNQSMVTPDFALDVANRMTAVRGNICFVLSSPLEILSSNPRIISGNTLSYRENLELTNYCTLFIGCSSGITWLCTSASAKKLPMLQLLDKRSSIFAGVNFDFEINGLDNKHIVELVDFTAEHVVECLDSILESGIGVTRKTYNQDYRPNRYNLRYNLRRMVWLNYSLKQLYHYARNFVLENGRYGNALPINRINMAADILAGYSAKSIYHLKSRAKKLMLFLELTTVNRK